MRAKRRQYAVPLIGVLEWAWDLGSFAMESRILRPLMWFGLLGSRWEGKAGYGEPRLYQVGPYEYLDSLALHLDAHSTLTLVGVTTLTDADLILFG